MDKQTDLNLKDGSRVAVIGGGPAGSFFGYFLLDMAERVGLKLHVDIYEPRDFSSPGPPGCNMCAGVVSESLVQNLAGEGINIPKEIIQRRPTKKKKAAKSNKKKIGKNEKNNRSKKSKILNHQ